MQGENSADTRLTFHRELSAHRFRNTPRQGKSQSSPVNLSGAHHCTPIKRFENMGKVRLVDANAAVLNGNSDFCMALVCGFLTESSDANPAIPGAVLDCIH